MSIPPTSAAPTRGSSGPTSRPRSAADQYDLDQELHRATSTLAGLTRGAGAAGEHEDPLVLVVKGELVHRYPGLIVFAAPDQARRRRTGARRDAPAGLRRAARAGRAARRVHRADRGAGPRRRAQHRPRRPLVVLLRRALHRAALRPRRAGRHEPRPGTPESWNDATWEHVQAPTGFLTESSSALDLEKGIDLSTRRATGGASRPRPRRGSRCSSRSDGGSRPSGCCLRRRRREPRGRGRAAAPAPRPGRVEHLEAEDRTAK